jgi:hypothetical protein
MKPATTVTVKMKSCLWTCDKWAIPFEKKYIQFSEDDIQKITGTYHQWQMCRGN